MFVAFAVASHFTKESGSRPDSRHSPFLVCSVASAIPVKDDTGQRMARRVWRRKGREENGTEAILPPLLSCGLAQARYN